MFEVLNLDQSENLQRFHLLSERVMSAYLRSIYYEVFCGGLKHMICFVYQDGDVTILLPGYLKRISIFSVDKEMFDFHTPYGYTGPFSEEPFSEEAIGVFWGKVVNWFKSNNVISCFIRFNLFGNYDGCIGELHSTMLNVKGKIIEEVVQWNNFEHKVRKNVKRAIREGLTSKILFEDIDDKSLREFYDIYIKTMQRTNASEFFFYSFDSFKNFIENNKKLCALCNIYDGELAVSTELLLLSNNSVFSFLGGTLEEAFDKRPNDFLKYEVINWARQEQFDFYVLGGGYGYEDGIFKYKKAFFPSDVVEYFTGRLIIDEKVYGELLDVVNNGRSKRGMKMLDRKVETYFPLYNKQN